MESVNDAPTEAEVEEKIKLVDTQGVMTKALLGAIRIDKKRFDGLGNNTRWVFDIDMLSGQSVKVDLLDFHGGELIEPNVMDTDISPMSSEAPMANCWWAQEGGSVTLHSHVIAEAPVRIRLRITVNVVCR